MNVRPHRDFFDAFLNNHYDRLFRYYAAFADDDWDRRMRIRLQRTDRRGVWWAVIQPVTQTAGILVQTNLRLPKGVLVRLASMKLSFARRPIRPGDPDTVGDPRRLELAPRRTPPSAPALCLLARAA